jgi:hypothetical protein
MPHTHAEIFAAMSDADDALKALLEEAFVSDRADTCRRLGTLALALRMACERFAEIEGAMKHKGKWN